MANRTTAEEAEPRTDGAPHRRAKLRAAKGTHFVECFRSQRKRSPLKDIWDRKSQSFRENCPNLRTARKGYSENAQSK